MATITISLPQKTAQQVDVVSKRRGYATRSEFVRTVLRDYLSQEDEGFEEFTPISPDLVRLELARTGRYNEKFIESVVEGLKQSSAYGS